MDVDGKIPLSVTADMSSTQAPAPPPPKPAQVTATVVTLPDGADFITQTDAQGRAISRPPAPIYDSSSGSSNNDDSDSSLTSPISINAPKKNRFFAWFCCFVGATPADFSDEIDEYAHTPPSGDGRTNAQSVKITAGHAAGGGNSNSSIPMTSINSGNSNGNKAQQQVYTRGNSNSNSNNKQSPHVPRHQSQRGMPQRHPHIGPVSSINKGKKCLVLDLDETLVHSSLREEPLAHMTIPVNIDNGIHDVYVIKRPGVDEFLKRMGEVYEIIIYTASLSKYADPLLDQLDIHKVISKRLFRENCVYHDGHYVKDLSLLNRDLQHCIIVDNSPMSYTFHVENAIDCGSFIDDPKDVEMWLIGDFLQGISKCDDVRMHCNHWREWCKKHPKLSTVPIEMGGTYITPAPVASGNGSG